MVSESVILSVISILGTVFGTLFGVYLGYSLPKKDKLKDEIYAPLISNLIDIEMGIFQVDLKKIKSVYWDKINNEHIRYKLGNSLKYKLYSYFTYVHNYKLSLNAKINSINDIAKNELINRKRGDELSGIPDDVVHIGRFVLSVIDKGDYARQDLLKLKDSYNSIKKEFDLTSMEHPDDFVHFIAKKIEKLEYPSSAFILEHTKEKNKMILFTRLVRERIESELTMFPKFTRFNNEFYKKI